MIQVKSMSVKMCVAIASAVLVTSCVTSTKVTFNTNAEPATLIIDGENKGQTPVTVRMSNGIWNDYEVILKRDGYFDMRTSVKKNIKPVNLVFGAFLWTPSLLWVYGPKDYQYFEMTKKEN